MSVNLFIGYRVNRLTIIASPTEDSTKPKSLLKWKCKCECGNITTVVAHKLKSTSNSEARAKSCGCLRKDSLRLKGKYSSILNVKPAKYGSELGSWYKMRSRCYDTDNRNYVYYGERGIKVCVRWRNSFINFYRDMGPKPTKKHTIDRINNDGDYKPSNCKWSTRKEQDKNRSKKYVKKLKKVGCQIN